MDEAEASRRAQAGDVTGFAELFELYKIKAYRTACIITRDSHLAEDMTQEAFVRAFQAIGRCDPDRPFAPWFMRILINVCRTAVQRRSRQTVVAELPEAAARPDPGLAATDDKVVLGQAIERLSPIHRDVLMLRYYHDFTEAEIAEALDIPPGTAKSRLHAARKLLEQVLGTPGLQTGTVREGLS